MYNFLEKHDTKNLYKKGVPGLLSRLSIQPLILALMVISGMWDLAPGRTPCSSGNLLQFSLPLPHPFSLFMLSFALT